MNEEKETTVGTTDNGPALEPVKTTTLEKRTAAPTPVPVEEPAADEAIEEPVDTRSETAKLFQAWVSENIHNSPLSEHTKSYNYLLEQLPALEAKLEGK